MSATEASFPLTSCPSPAFSFMVNGAATLHQFAQIRSLGNSCTLLGVRRKTAPIFKSNSRIYHPNLYKRGIFLNFRCVHFRPPHLNSLSGSLRPLEWGANVSAEHIQPFNIQSLLILQSHFPPPPWPKETELSPWTDTCFLCLNMLANAVSRS